MMWIGTKRGLVAIMVVFLCTIVAQDAVAQLQFDGFNTASKICDIYKIVTGKTAKAFATFAIIILGLSVFFGKVTWGQAVLVAVCIGVVFGALSIATTLTGYTGTAGSCHQTIIEQNGGSTTSIQSCDGLVVPAGACTPYDPCIYAGFGSACEVCNLLNGTQCARPL